MKKLLDLLFHCFALRLVHAVEGVDLEMLVERTEDSRIARQLAAEHENAGFGLIHTGQEVAGAFVSLTPRKSSRAPGPASTPLRPCVP